MNIGSRTQWESLFGTETLSCATDYEVWIAVFVPVEQASECSATGTLKKTEHYDVIFGVGICDAITVRQSETNSFV